MPILFSSGKTKADRIAVTIQSSARPMRRAGRRKNSRACQSAASVDGSEASAASISRGVQFNALSRGNRRRIAALKHEEAVLRTAHRRKGAAQAARSAQHPFRNGKLTRGRKREPSPKQAGQLIRCHRGWARGIQHAGRATFPFDQQAHGAGEVRNMNGLHLPSSAAESGRPGQRGQRGKKRGALPALPDDERRPDDGPSAKAVLAGRALCSTRPRRASSDETASALLLRRRAPKSGSIWES